MAAWGNSPPLGNADRAQMLEEQERGCGAGEADLRLVLLGGRNSGKSSAGNIILRRMVFAIGCEVNCRCAIGQGTVAGKKVTVVDTPGWDYFMAPIPWEIKRETERSVSLCSPGPHAFLLTILLGSDVIRTRVEEHMHLLGETAWGYTLVLFTCGDRLADSTIEQYIVSKGGALQSLLGKCENKYHVLNNLNTSDETQVRELLTKVEHIRSKNFGWYRCEIPWHIEPDVQPEQEQEPSQQGAEREKQNQSDRDQEGEHNTIERDQGGEQNQYERDQMQNTSNHGKAPQSEGTTEISLAPTCLPVNRSEEALAETLQRLSPQMSGEDIYRHTVDLFTYTDRLQGQGVEEHFRTGGRELQELVGVCCGGCHTLDNRYQGNSCQVAELLGKVDETVVGSRASFYSCGETQAGGGMWRPIQGDKQRREGEPGEGQQEEGQISGTTLEAGAHQVLSNVEQGRPPQEREGEGRAGMRGVQLEREELGGPMERAQKEEKAVEMEAHPMPACTPSTRTSSAPARRSHALQQLQLSALRAQSAAASQEYSTALTQRDQEIDILHAEIERLRESCAEKDTEIERLKEEVVEVRRRFEETAREVEKNRRVLQQLRALAALVNTAEEGE